MASLKYWLWLASLKGLGGQTRLALLRHFGDPESVYYADPGEIRLVEHITKEQSAVLENKSMKTAEKILADCQSLDVRVLTIHDGEYPGRLKNIYDPPIVLYCRGRLPVFDEEAVVAVVGTRGCTPYGVACARKLGHGLARGGAVVVSGLAAGIDAEATQAALMAGGFTVGVLGNGVDVPYPYACRRLYEDLAMAGVLISEYPPGTRPLGGHFPARNRIISGLSVATVVVEAPEKSGALITAELALDQGRDLFAVPGPIDAPNSIGCNRLIRDGAGVASDAWDILREYEGRFPGKLTPEGTHETPPERFAAPPVPAAKPVPPAYSLKKDGQGLTDDQIALLRLLPAEEGAYIDDLVEESGIPTRRVLSALTMLEIDELVAQQSGKRYIRTVTITE